MSLKNRLLGRLTPALGIALLAAQPAWADCFSAKESCEARCPSMATGFVLGMAGALKGNSAAQQQGERDLKQAAECTDRCSSQYQSCTERESAQRQQQEAVQQRQQAQQRATQERVQAEQRAQAAQALVPPPAYDGRIVIHRGTLTQAQTGNERPDFEITSPGTVSLSPDGAWLAFETTGGQIVLRDTASGKDRVVPTRVPAQILSGGHHIARQVSFVGSDALLITGSKGAELLDLQGNSLRVLPPGGYARPHKTGKGHVIEYERYTEKEYRQFCAGVSYYDAKGAELGSVTVHEADGCISRMDAQGQYVVLSHKNGIATYYVNGAKVGEFQGDNRYKDYDSFRSWATYRWLGDGAYAFSALNAGGSTYQYRLWDVAQGRMLCELSEDVALGGWPFADKRGHFFTSQPPVRLGLPDCSRVRVSNGNERLIPSSDSSVVYLLNEQTGSLDIVDTATWQRRTTLQTQYRKQGKDDNPLVQGIPGQPHLLLVGSWGGNIPTQLFDVRTGELLRKLPEKSYFESGYIKQWNHVDPNFRTRLWRFAHEDGSGQPVAAFLAALKKDKFETTAQYQERLAAQTLPHAMQVKLVDYDADRGLFMGNWRGAPVQVPLPPAQARQFADAKDMNVSGELRMIDEDFLELRNASIITPSGQTQPLTLPEGIPPKAAPASAQSPVGASGSGAGSAQRAGAISGVPPAKAAAVPAGCSDAEMQARLQKTLDAAPASGGICVSGRWGKRLADETLAVIDTCPSTPALENLRKEMIQFRKDSQGMIDGACG